MHDRNSDSERGDSPVIGVILMVGVTVVFGATIGVLRVIGRSAQRVPFGSA
jgi:flagellin-like protein